LQSLFRPSLLAERAYQVFFIAIRDRYYASIEPRLLLSSVKHQFRPVNDKNFGEPGEFFAPFFIYFKQSQLEIFFSRSLISNIQLYLLPLPISSQILPCLLKKLSCILNSSGFLQHYPSSFCIMSSPCESSV